MKAVLCKKYGTPDDLQLAEVERPVPGKGEVLVKVHAASLHPDVWHVVRGLPLVLRVMGGGFLRPKQPIPGTDLSGRVESLGDGVSRFNVGDAVFGESIANFQWANGGAYAEYVCVPEANLVIKPESVSFEEAASIPTSGYIALFNLREVGKYRPGMRVLVNGAAGGVGSLVLQLAKGYGSRVTGVEHTRKLEMIKALGADHVIDYTKEDCTQSGETYDLVVDIPGGKPYSQWKRVLSADGIYVSIGHSHFDRKSHRWFGEIPRMLGLSLRAMRDRHLPTMSSNFPEKSEVMAILKEFLEARKITPIIDRTFPLERVPEAFRYMESGEACGRIVITI